MAGFSPTDAALEGFRIARERPRALLACSLFVFAISLLGVFIEVSMPAEARAAREALAAQEPLEPGALLEAMTVLSPILLFGLLAQCVMAAAIYRILLHEREGSIRLFRLGPTELRLMALAMVALVLTMFAFAAAVLFSVLAAAIVSPFGEAAMYIMGTAAWIFSLGVIIHVAVRLSLAPVITFDRGRLSILDSWPMTRGCFWRLCGAYVLAIACVVVVAVLALMVFLPVAGIVVITSGGSLADVGEIIRIPEENTFAAHFEPLRVAYMLVSSLFNALWYAVIAAPGAYAYRALQASQPQA
jgi:hypothetical protein